MRSFLYRTEYDVNNSIRLVVTFASIDMESTPSILLDLDAICEGTEPLAIDDALSVVDDLHSQVETTFEALVTDSTRETFDA